MFKFMYDKCLIAYLITLISFCLFFLGGLETLAIHRGPILLIEASAFFLPGIATACGYWSGAGLCDAACKPEKRLLAATICAALCSALTFILPLTALAVVA